ncbi:reverse transcriptase domain-containing protein [Tanacetum coccineum]
MNNPLLAIPRPPCGIRSVEEKSQLHKTEDSGSGHWKSRSKRKKSSGEEDDLSYLWAAVKTERWAMSTWCHMFNSTLTGNARVWFDDLSAESIDNYDDLKKAFLENYLQQKKCIKDPIEIHIIKQREGESTEDFGGSGSLESQAEEVVSTMETARGQSEAKFQESRLSEPAKAKKEARSVYAPHKNSQRNFRFRQRKIKAPPPMTTPIEKRNHAKFCEFHGEVGHNTDECMHLKKQIEEMLKAGKLSHLIKELKQNNEKEQPKAVKKGETFRKDKALVIIMESIALLYEHCFSQLCPEIKNQLVPATTPLIGFSGEIVWPIGQIQLLVKIGDEEHPTSSWMNFVFVRSPSPYNGIIERPGVKKLQAVPSTAHEMLKLPVEGGVITLKSSRMVPLECAMVS